MNSYEEMENQSPKKVKEKKHFYFKLYFNNKLKQIHKALENKLNCWGYNNGKIKVPKELKVSEILVLKMASAFIRCDI